MAEERIANSEGDAVFVRTRERTLMTPLLDLLPPDLIKRIISTLFAMGGKGSIQATMQTCSTMRLICCGFISTTFVPDFRALWRFPRLAKLKTLSLHVQRMQDTCNWLATYHAMDPHGRLSSVENITLQRIAAAESVFVDILPALALVCPALRCLSVEGQLRPGHYSDVHEVVWPFPSLEELTIKNFHLLEDCFSPGFFPPGLKKLHLPDSPLSDRWAVHLAGMKCLNDIEVQRFILSAPVVLSDSCAWRRVSILDLNLDINAASTEPCPSHWPPGSQLVLRKPAISWHIRHGTNEAPAKELAAALARLPFRAKDGGPARFEVSVEGSSSFLAPLSAFISSIRFIYRLPTAQELKQIHEHLPLVTALGFPPYSMAGDFLQLVDTLIGMTNIAEVSNMPDVAAFALAVKARHSFTIRILCNDYAILLSLRAEVERVRRSRLPAGCGECGQPVKIKMC